MQVNLSFEITDDQMNVLQAFNPYKDASTPRDTAVTSYLRNLCAASIVSTLVLAYQAQVTPNQDGLRAALLAAPAS